MNEAPTDAAAAQRKSQAIAAALGLNLVFGVVVGMLYPELGSPEAVQQAVAALRQSGLNIAYQVALLIACFTWLATDSRQLGIRRPWWLDLGVVLITSLFVPYYLWKTRPEGQRGAAIFAFFGVVFGCLLAMVLGMFAALAMHGPPQPAPAGL